MSVDEMEIANINLKERIEELEIALMPPPIFASPITIMKPYKTLDGTREYSSKLKGQSSLLADVRKYIGKNIRKRMPLILETWEYTFRVAQLYANKHLISSSTSK
jgi:hypothetical protein